LDDTATYRRLTYDPIHKFQKIIEEHINFGLHAGYLDQRTAAYLHVPFPRHPVLYTLPKLHKDSTNPPGRPIVSANE
ncbi:Hypothetical predicted protein, partial [Pelobates cultripes]